LRNALHHRQNNGVKTRIAVALERRMPLYHAAFIDSDAANQDDFCIIGRRKSVGSEGQ
jgi:hypothetical protein